MSVKKIFVSVMLMTLAVPVTVFAQKAQSAPRVLVDTVIGKKPVVYRKYNGLFEPVEKYTALARVSGNLEKINFQEGDIVEANQTLFEIEDTRYQAAVKSAKSEIDVIKAKIRYAQNNYDRSKKLAETQALAEDTAENTLSVLEGFQAQLLGAEANLTLAEEDLNYTQILSPIKGRIGRVNYTEGNYITPNSGPLVTVVQIDPIYVRFSMSERDFTRMFGTLENLQKEAQLSLELASGEKYNGKGTISFIDNQIKSKTDTIYVWATYENPEAILNPGGLGTVILARTQGEERPAVKLSAVMFDTEGHYVYTLEDKEFDDVDQTGQKTGTHIGKAAVRRNVELGPADAEYQTILSGVSAGETIIVDGTHKATPGGEVIPVLTEEKQPEAQLEGTLPVRGSSAEETPAAVPAAPAPAAASDTSLDTPLDTSLDIAPAPSADAVPEAAAPVGTLIPVTEPEK